MERFTQRARRALGLAQEEAQRRRHPAIDSEHLLLGLMHEEGGVARRVLQGLGVDDQRMDEVVERLHPAGSQSPAEHLDLSSGTKKALEQAVGEARRLGHRYIGTEHLLLGLVRLPEGLVLDVLRELGLSPEEVRRQTRRVLQEAPTPPVPQPRELATFQAHDGPVHLMAFSPDGTLLATAAEHDETVRLWQLPEGREVAALGGHSAPVQYLAFTLARQGQLLAVACQDGTVKLWQIA